MKALSRLAAALVCAMSLAGCLGLEFFQDIGIDPHPPTLTLISIGLEPLPPPEPVGEPPPEAPPEEMGSLSVVVAKSTVPVRKTFDTGGFTIHLSNPVLNQLVIALTISDLGGDMTQIRIRDRNGALNGAAALTVESDDPDSGTSVLFPYLTTNLVVYFPDSWIMIGTLGPHHLEIWVEDSKGSRSEKTEFIITVDN